MNPAALQTNIGDLPKGGTVIVNADAFSDRTLQKAGYAANPIEDGSLGDYHLHEVPLTSMTVGALKEVEGITSPRGRALEELLRAGADVVALPPADRRDRGVHRAEVREAARDRRREHRGVPRRLELRRDVRGLRGLVRGRARASSRPARTARSRATRRSRSGLIAAAKLSGLPLFLGAYPITPASSILEELAGKKEFGVVTFQAEDEIAAVGAAVGAAFGGALGVTASAGPGVVLKAETVGLAIALELPLVILDIQRAGPSTGMPTKPEQADLLMVLYGRNGESPVPVVAASTPSGCFDAAIEAVRLAVKYRTPVYLLSDAYLANGSEPWLVPDVSTCRTSRRRSPSRRRPVRAVPARSRDARPPVGDPRDARARAPHRRAREGRRDRGDLLRRGQPRPDGPAARAEGGRDRGRHPRARGRRPGRGGRALVVGWGSTYGPIGAAIRRVRKRGAHVAHAHLHYLNPFPRNTGDVLQRYRKVLVPEMNLGQLALLLRAEFLVDAVSYTSVRGRPLTAAGARGRDHRPAGWRGGAGEGHDDSTATASSS